MEFIVGGMSGCAACCFTNPLDVAKTRMQLQGELMTKGQSTQYKTPFHAIYQIYKVEGMRALQKGLSPALYHQFVLNGFRLGSFRWFSEGGFTTDECGDVSPVKTMAAGAASGVLASFAAAPLEIVKVQLQAAGSGGLFETLSQIHTQRGLRGLWRGVVSSMTRLALTSSAQLTIYSWCQQHLAYFSMLPEKGVLNGAIASGLSGVSIVFFSTPFDLVSTRLHSQPIGEDGKGLLYASSSDCFIKTFQKEGLPGFYKGWSASLLRNGPHAALCLLIWNRLEKLGLDWIKARNENDAVTETVEAVMLKLKKEKDLRNSED